MGGVDQRALRAEEVVGGVRAGSEIRRKQENNDTCPVDVCCAKASTSSCTPKTMGAVEMPLSPF